jgi:hypothetical protein
MNALSYSWMKFQGSIFWVCVFFCYYCWDWSCFWNTSWWNLANGPSHSGENKNVLKQWFFLWCYLSLQYLSSSLQKLNVCEYNWFGIGPTDHTYACSVRTSAWSGPPSVLRVIRMNSYGYADTQTYHVIVQIAPRSTYHVKRTSGSTSHTYVLLACVVPPYRGTFESDYGQDNWNCCCFCTLLYGAK